jgi:hypothetical protein
MSKTSKTIKTSKIIGLQLSDIIKIIDPETPILNNSIFIIDYIDETILKLINAETLTTTELNINKDQTIEKGTITEIHLLSRYDSPSYAVQNKLLPKTWINIYFGGNMSMVVTGEITNLEEDMIEVKRYPEGDFIYINFDYKGIPKNLPIEYIQIRGPIQKLLADEEQDEDVAEKEIDESPESPEEKQEIIEDLTDDYFDNDVLETKPKIDIKNQLREFILKADAIKFEDEIIGNVFQYVVVDKEKQRYSIESQTNDLLDDLLSTIPTLKRKGKVLNDIHKMIERYKQLRTSFSVFDENGNIISKKYKTADWKPLKKYYNEFDNPLYWLIPVVKNIKKIYVDEVANDVNDSEDVIKYEIMEDILDINNIIKNSSKTEENRYSNLYLELNNTMTPFEYNNYEDLSDIIKQVEVGSNMNVITENFDDFTSTFISNDIQKPVRFGMQQYTTGTTKLLTSSVTSSSKMIPERVELTPADVLEIKSFITLPEEYNRFSRIHLPGTNILDKSIVSKYFLNYSKILNNKSNVQNIYVDNLNSKIKFNADNYLNNIKHYSLKLQDTDKKLDKNEIYNKFIDIITPNIEVLFNLIKKHIQSNLTVTQAVEYLEPFYIYPDDLSYSHYLLINDFINNKISEYNKNYIENSKTFNLLKQIKVKNVKKFQFTDLISKKSVFEDYNDNFLNYLLSDIELLKYMLDNDSSQLFNNALSLENIKLNYSSDISSLFQKDEKQITSNMSRLEKENTCKTYNIAKYYNDITRLEEDNGHIVYYDTKYDTTNYNLLNDYSKEITYMETDDFYNFLIKDLSKKMKMNNSQIIELVNTLIEGKKIVAEGDYGILHYITDNTNISNISYYIRKNNNWVLAEDPPKGFITDDKNILCNLQNECMSQNYNNENKCIPTDLSELSLRKKLINSVMTEFDKKYDISLKEQQDQINKKYEYYQNVLPKLKLIKTHRVRKYNNKCYKLGLNSKENNIVISPYFKLRDFILGIDDFIKKQHYIIKFVENFTRSNYNSEVGPLGEKENEHWLYCVKTDVRLFPTFKYKLAVEYLTSPDSYNIYVDLLIKEIGKLSDDGDTWIDKHSGYIIKLINFDVEEGYEDGFKIKTRDEMEEDAGESLILSNVKKANIFDNPESKLIYNIINTVSSETGVNIDNQIEFIISNVLNVIKEKLPSEMLYKSYVKEMIAKGKQMPSYNDLYNSKLMYSTIGLILIAIQTSVPPVKTRKTFPGCVKSFSGFPFDGVGDLSCLNYFVCVMYSLNESWNFLKGVNKNLMMDRLKKSIEDDLYELPDVTSKISAKTDFVINDVSNLTDEEYQVVKLTNFLPPLVKFSVKNVANITVLFKDKLKDELKNGILTQSHNILVIQSKIIKFSLAIQTSIQEVINKKKLLLKSLSNQQYIENACCNEPGYKSAIEYFMDKDKNIISYNDEATKMVNILDDINNLYRATLFSTKINTKYIYPNLSLHTNEETIYLAFIIFCKFKSLAPIDFDLLQFCAEKPKYINSKDTNTEIIRKLKTDGLVYSNDLFLKLLQVVNRSNIIHLNISDIAISPLDNLYYFLNNTIMNKQTTPTSINEEDIISDKFQKLLKEVVNIYGVENPQNDKAVKNLNVYLNNENVSMKQQIIDFLRKNCEMTKKKLKNIEEFLTNINVWENDTNVRNQDIKISKESLFNGIHFLKNYIHNLTSIFPNIILNKVNYDDIEIQKYWKLSANHQSDIINIIAEYYTTIKKYYGDTILQNVLQEIKSFSNNIKILSKEIPSYNSINYKNITETPIFNERTSYLLFEYLFLLTIFSYVKIGLSDMTILKPYHKRQKDNTENNTVESIEDNVTKNDIVEIITSEDVFINQGNKRALRRKVADLLITYIDIMMKHKHNIDRSYDNILDTIFKLKEKEKDTFTDRLKALTNEQRDVDTILKINKLGVWNKGLQKGLTTYVKETYDEEREFGEKMAQYEKLILKTKMLNDKNRNSSLEDFMEQQQIDNEINYDNDVMHLMNDDYQDGNYGGDEIDNYEDYN